MLANFNKLWPVCLAIALLAMAGCSNEESTPSVSSADSDAAEAIDIKALRLEQREKFKTTGELQSPVRIEADGEPIDISLQQSKTGGIAHAGPTIADVDGDGDCDLLVGDFPGYFWLFENESDDANPRYVAKGKLQAGDEAAKTPVY